MLPCSSSCPFAVQAAPVAQPTLEPVQPSQGIPAVQAAPSAVQAVPSMQPVVEVAPVGVVADTNVTVSAESVCNATTKWFYGMVKEK